MELSAKSPKYLPTFTLNSIYTEKKEETGSTAELETNLLDGISIKKHY